ncbi:hypothetical protein [Deinococcus radiotolerans]|uniref:Uncharacterized protein n=1 Tax=Deinococcus radiotolerans TaxID=1309407 RepID=A0ABQ2FIG8_9DEIO|nr:hypothetical protein [Deinococcus radiotolerans]GGK95261.1 hypothetical protein GCM10010844_12160 [Deinococcus radiotolerans]
MDNLKNFIAKIDGLSEVMSDGNSDFRAVEKNPVLLTLDLPADKLVVFKYQLYSRKSDINTKIYIDNTLLRTDKFYKANFFDKRFSFNSKGKFNLRINYSCTPNPCDISQIRQYDSQISVVNYPDTSHTVGLNATLYQYNSQSFPVRVQGLADLLFENGRFYRQLTTRDVSLHLDEGLRPLHLVLTVAGSSGFSVELKNLGRILGQIHGDQVNSAHGVFDLSSVTTDSDIKLIFKCNDGGYACVKVEQLGLALADTVSMNYRVAINYAAIFAIFLLFFLLLIRKVKPQKTQNNSP